VLAIRSTLAASLRFLEPGMTKASRRRVVDLLGPPYGEWGPDVLLYPGEDANRFFRVELAGGAVVATGFVTILDAEYGK
jgi:hypothetical protein